jgi:hypothetical protein
MTASPGREVDANLLRGAAPGSAQPRAHAQDAGGQDLGDLVEALGGGHEVGVKGVGQCCDCRGCSPVQSQEPALRNIIASNEENQCS